MNVDHDQEPALDVTQEPNCDCSFSSVSVCIGVSDVNVNTTPATLERMCGWQWWNVIQYRSLYDDLESDT